MTEQKICGTCFFWDKEAEGVVGSMSNDGEFRKDPELKTGFCRKHKKAKSEYDDPCDDWEPKK